MVAGGTGGSGGCNSELGDGIDKGGPGIYLLIGHVFVRILTARRTDRLCQIIRKDDALVPRSASAAAIKLLNSL